MLISSLFGATIIQLEKGDIIATLGESVEFWMDEPFLAGIPFGEVCVRVLVVEVDFGLGDHFFGQHIKFTDTACSCHYHHFIALLSKYFQ